MRSLKLLPRPQIFATLLFRDTTNRYFPASVCIFNSLRIIFVLHKFSSDSCCLAQEDSHYKANRKASKLRIKVRLLLYPGSKYSQTLTLGSSSFFLSSLSDPAPMPTVGRADMVNSHISSAQPPLLLAPVPSKRSQEGFSFLSSLLCHPCLVPF